MVYKINDKDRKAYIIVGCHFAATSFLANAIKNMGVYMGTRYHRRSGADRHFVRINERILANAGGTWDNPPSDEEMARSLKPFNKRQIVKILRNYRKHSKWGIKDSRLALTWRHFLPYLKEKDEDVYLFCCFRRPDRIIDGNNKRSKNKLNRKLVDRYNWGIIELIKEFCELEKK